MFAGAAAGNYSGMEFSVDVIKKASVSDSSPTPFASASIMSRFLSSTAGLSPSGQTPAGSASPSIISSIAATVLSNNYNSCFRIESLTYKLSILRKLLTHNIKVKP
jgi:hypothetical protein